METLHNLIAGHLRRRWGISNNDYDIPWLVKQLGQAVDACNTGHNGLVMPSPDGVGMTAEDLVRKFELDGFLVRH